MRKQTFTNFMKRLPLRHWRGALLAPVIALIFGAGIAQAYGPTRPTFTIEKPADHITFNSITNNPNYGDERNFLIVKDAANTAPGGWTDSVKVQNGKEYLVRLYVHNNAAANLNLTATNTRAMVNVPNNASTSIQIDGFITADNANPQKVWDDVVLTSDNKFTVAYVPGSAEYTNNINPNPGFKLPDSLVTSSGALLGYRSMDGNVPGCFQYSGIVTFKVKVADVPAPNFTVKKQVSVSGQNKWQDSLSAKPGDKVDFLVTYTNTGTAQQDNVVVRDALPKGLTYVAGSTMLANTQTPNGSKVADAVTTNGLNIGAYAPQGNAFVKFTATVDASQAKCGANTLTNTATVVTANGNKQGSANVEVTADCKTNECKPGVPAGDARCNECQPGIPAGDARCNPAAPGELPHTGLGSTILVGVLIAAAVGAFFYWDQKQLARKRAAEKGTKDYKNVIVPADGTHHVYADGRTHTPEHKK